MNTRYLIPLLLAGAIALAIRSRSADAGIPLAASVRQAGATAAAPLPARPVVKKVRPKQVPGGPALVSDLRAAADPHGVHFDFEVTNVTRKDLELSFPDGQEYEFTVLNAAGREVYRWGATRMFTQSLKNRVIEGGETMRIEERGAPTLAPGSYTAVATLKASNHPLQQRVALVVR
jgi:hypothetical protein